MQAAVFRFEPGGRLRRHPGGDPQIFAVLDGSGEVSGAGGNDEPIEAGEAVFLHQGEEHGMKSAAGLTALIIEGKGLDRFRARPTAAPSVDLWVLGHYEARPRSGAGTFGSSLKTSLVLWPGSILKI